MKNFSDDLQKAIEKERVLINEIKKSALIIFNLQVNENAGRIIWELKQSLGLKAELENFGYSVEILKN